MDGLCDLLHKTARPGIKYNEQIDGFETSEIYSHAGLMKFRTRKISNDNVMSWLNRSDAVHDNHCDILRVVWVERNIASIISPWKHKISEKNEDRVMERFDLKKPYQLVADGSIICLPVEDRHDSKKQHFALAMFGHSATLIWTHDFTTNRTEAFWSGGDALLLFSLARPILESQKNLARHPMFLALIAAMCLSQGTQIMIEPICDKINQVENRTQHCPASLMGHAATEGNYAALSAMMSACATRLAGFQGRHQTLDDIFDSISAYRWPHGAGQPEWAETIGADIDECISILKKVVRGQQQRILYLSRRADIQLTALFNLIAQQETRLSISVAEDSRMLAMATKEDSTAMRTLAAVTIIFLPGTFVAAFFSMPLFRWDTQTRTSSSVLSRQFWVYWAVTGPLTLGTFALWLVWMRLQTQRRRAHDLEGKEALYPEVDCRQQSLQRDRWEKPNGFIVA